MSQAVGPIPHSEAARRATESRRRRRAERLKEIDIPYGRLRSFEDLVTENALLRRENRELQRYVAELAERIQHMEGQ